MQQSIYILRKCIWNVLDIVYLFWSNVVFNWSSMKSYEDLLKSTDENVNLNSYDKLLKYSDQLLKS